MQRTRLLALLAAAAAMAAAAGLAGCGAGALPARVSLSVYAYSNRDDPVDAANWDYVVGVFEAANPTIRLGVEFGFTNPYHDRLRALAAAGKLPDIVFLWPDKRTAYVTGAGLAKDLRPYLAGHEREFVAGALDPQYGGGVWEVPEQVTDSHVMFTNTRLLASLGLSQPRTLEELLAQLPVIRARGLLPIAMDDGDGWQLQSCLLSALVERTGGRAWLERAIRGDQASFTDAPFASALAVLERLARAGAFAPGMLEAEYGTAVHDFAAGRAVYLVDGGWRVNTLVAALPPSQQRDIALRTFPDLPGASGTPGSTSSVVGTGYGMSARLRGAKAQAAWKWIWFYSGPVGSAIRQGFGANPAYILPKRSDLAPLVQQLIDFSAATPSGYVLDSVLDAPTMDVLQPALKELVRGTRSPRQVAEAVESWVAAHESDRLQASRHR